MPEYDDDPTANDDYLSDVADEERSGVRAPVTVPLVNSECFYVRVGLTRIPFRTPTDARYTGLADFAECCLCGAVVDVGGEITQHAAEHAEG